MPTPLLNGMMGAPSIGTAYVYAPWTEVEEQFLVDTYSTLTAKEQTVQLARQNADVVAKRMRMLKKGRFEGLRRAYHPPWTQQEDDWLRQAPGLLTRIDDGVL